MLTLFYEFLTDDELLLISAKIKEMEKKTSGEIAISIKEQRGMLQKGKPLSGLAEDEFRRLGMFTTQASTGILIYIILKTRELYILADKAIHGKAKEGIWEEIKNRLLESIKKGESCQGLLNAVEEVGKLYQEHLPPPGNNINEVSNRVVVLP